MLMAARCPAVVLSEGADPLRAHWGRTPGPAALCPCRPRRTEPVCSGLQAQILRCYRDHLQEVLLCSDLVKAYQHCVSAAHKVRPRPAPGLGC